MNNLKLEILAHYKKQFEKEPALLVRAPGRINLIGEHTDYNEGFVLPAAIDKEIVFAIGLSPTENFHLSAYDLKEKYTFTSNQLSVTKEKSWANYLIGVIAQFEKKGYKVPPLLVSYGGNVPLGAGLSSSAAVECGIAFGINELIKAGLEKNDLAFIAQKAEHEFAGVQCGIMDQFASIMGKKEHVIRLDCKTLEYNYFPFPMDHYQIVLCDTQVKHSLASSEYNTRRKECEKGVSVLKNYFPEINSLRDVTLDMLMMHETEIDAKVYNRCAYVVQENDRVLKGCNDLASGDLVAFGKRMYASHDGLSRHYEVSCKELDFLVEQTKNNPSVLGARMMGGGFGGCTINLVKVDEIQKFEEEMKESYQRQFNIPLETYQVTIENGTGLASI